ncbi:dihydropteroate synthase [Thalassotalea profundi]|uniref:Dihydropteroate synthase n=1 Tax=Thalassotalea profundi TaxID=2036687 RepID=A0ABQ3J7U4_9GAMM|nr:dihydropteroate synthase [Thalassotalea profundi]GHF01533.1 dihydropteroate synthase [Thalassotalea profundi]
MLTGPTANLSVCSRFKLDLTQPKVMGIVNVTPDSFSDGGKFNNIDLALHQVEKMISEGASIIDIGGESTRPGAAEVSDKDELERTIPLLKAIRSRFDILISIDTSKASVMAESIIHGVDIINDVRALQNKGCIEVAAQTDIPICLMHMQGKPRTMQVAPIYNDLIEDIKLFFQQRIEQCQKAGIERQRIILDPGFGFGKTLEQNYKLLANLQEFSSFKLPILSGTSRKSMIGNLLNCPPQERLAGSLATALLAAQNGAHIIRVHDVKETVDALRVLATAQNNK